MTNITIQCSGDTYRMAAVGHAAGNSEVCAAVSAIVYALGGYLKNLEAAGPVKLRALTLGSGAAGIEAAGQESRIAFEMAAVGLMQIAAKYPELVAVDAQDFFKSPAGFLPCRDRMEA